ncbi:hypothetical protein WR25_09819 [Diploscapter pachys]|uniref:Ubiquitin carboxyl-terminal hydrolase n=1 Tax=Diploscapter pachys TaxID=2018661 RepID=A0A2A2LGV8_9BILA|nr:hypothetical protein WR25_09819 [Diploscapter pachys]
MIFSNKHYFSYQCDDFVGNDTEDQKIQLTRESLREMQNFKHCHMPPEFDLSLDLEGLETEEENDSGAKAIQERIVQLDEDSGSVPEEEVIPGLRPNASNGQLDRNLSSLHLSASKADLAVGVYFDSGSGPLIGGRALRPRKRRINMALSPSPPPRDRKNGGRNAMEVHFRGLRNLGNTCFMNSIIQALQSADVFRNYLTRLPILEPDDIVEEQHPLVSPAYNTRRASIASFSGSPSSPTDISNVVAEELRKVLISLTDLSETSAYSPDSFLQAMWKMSPRFRGYQQQDAHEFLRVFIDRLHAELRRCRIPESLDRWLTSVIGGQPANPNGTAVSRIFEGSLQSQVICLTCHTASNKHDPFMDLSLDIFVPAANGRAQTMRLQDCIRRFFDKEELDQCEQYMCGNCMDKRPSTKQLFLKVLPNVLCLHLKRFRWSHVSYNRGKLDNMVDFPLTGLDISQYMAPSALRDKNEEHVTFDLSSLVVHHGSGVNCGHYVTFGKHNGRWYLFNDSSVKPCSESTVLRQKAYLLFYTRSTHSPSGVNSGMPSTSRR